MAKGCQHPTLSCLEPLFTGAFAALQGTGRGAGAEPPDPWAKLRARGSSTGREHPLQPCTEAGLSYHLGRVGFVTDGSQPPRVGSASLVGCGRRHSRKDELEALSPALAPQLRGQRPTDLPNSWARVALGPRGLRPALTHTCAPCPLPSPALTWRRQLLGPTYLLAPGKAPCSRELGCPGSLPAPTYSHWMCRCWLHPSLLGVPGRSSSSGSGGVTPAGAVTMSMATILSPRVCRVELRGSARGAEMGWRVTD